MHSQLLDTFMHDHYGVSKILENNLFNTWKMFFKWLKSAACLAGNGSKTSMAFSLHPKLLACDVTCLTIARHITDSWQNERKLRYMPMIDLVQFSNSISQRSWHFLCNVCYDPNKVLLNVRHGFILGGLFQQCCIKFRNWARVTFKRCVAIFIDFAFFIDFWKVVEVLRLRDLYVLWYHSRTAVTHLQEKKRRN